MEGAQEENNFETIHAEGAAASGDNPYDVERRALEAEEANGEGFYDPEAELRKVKRKQREHAAAKIGERGLTEQVEARTAVGVNTAVTTGFTDPPRQVTEPVGVSELYRLSEEGAEDLLRDVTDALEDVPEDRREDVFHNLRDRAIASLQGSKGSRRAAEEFVDRYLSLPLGEQSPYTQDGVRDEDVTELDPPAWLVEDLIPAGQVGVITGASGLGKSWLVTELARAVAFGGRWLGKPVENTGHVRAFLPEGRIDFPRRLAGSLIREGELEQGADRSGLARLLDGRVSVSAGHATLDDPRLEDHLRADIEERRTRLVVFDTLNRSLGAGQSENETDAAQRTMNRLQRLAIDTGATVLLIHHPPQGDEVRERGSGVWGQAADFRFLIYGDTQEFARGKPATLVNAKQRTAAPAGNVSYRLSEWTMLYDGEESDTASIVSRPVTSTEEATKAEQIRWYLTENPGATQNNVVQHVRGGKQEIVDELERLDKAGKIQNEREGEKGPWDLHLAGEWAEEAEAEAAGFDADEAIAPDDVTGDGGGGE